MYTTHRVSPKPVSYTAPVIHQNNSKSWETLAVSVLKADQLRTASTIPYQKIINREQENNYIVISAVYEIILHENQKVSYGMGALEYIKFDFDESELYHNDNMSIDDTKEKLEWCKRAFECKQDITHGI